MAGIVLSQLQLIDGFPGEPNSRLGVPKGGWDNTEDNFTTTSTTDGPKYPLGTKITQYSDNTNAPGFYTMAYLSFHGLITAPFTISAGDWCTGAAWCAHLSNDATGCMDFNLDTSSNPWHAVGPCISTSTDASEGGCLALPCATLSSDGSTNDASGFGGAYGWFWVGGVCPINDCTKFDDATGAGVGMDVSTSTTMRPGAIAAGASSAQMVFQSADQTAWDVSGSGGPLAVAVAYCCASAEA